MCLIAGIMLNYYLVGGPVGNLCNCAGSMGQRAQSLFAKNGIKVVIGAPGDEPEKVAAAWLAGTLQTGANVCDH